MVTRVAIADDHQLVRAGLAALLADIPDIAVVGEAADGNEALQLATQARPDILFLDLVMPGIPGLEALELIKSEAPAVQVVILSMYAGKEHVLRAFKLGAAGFIVKDAAPEELALAIKAITQGHTWLSPAVSKTVVSDYLEQNGSENVPGPLTPRQTQVLKMIAEGHSTKRISNALNLSVKTIETYRIQIMNKLDIHDVTGLVRYAIRQSIIPL